MAIHQARGASLGKFDCFHCQSWPETIANSAGERTEMARAKCLEDLETQMRTQQYPQGIYDWFLDEDQIQIPTTNKIP